MARMSGNLAKRNKSNYIISWSLLAVLLLLAVPDSAFSASWTWVKNELKSDHPTLFVDHWSAMERSKEAPYTVFFVEMNPADMVYERNPRGFTATYRLVVTVFDEQGEFLAEKSMPDSMWVPTYRLTQSSAWNRLYKFRFQLADGRYNVMVALEDITTRKTAVKLGDMEVRHSPGFALEMSDVLVARQDRVEDPDMQPASTILPFPARAFGPEQPVAFCYFEVYCDCDLEGHPDSIEYHISYIDPEDGQTFLQEATIPAGRGRQPIMARLDVNDLPPGEYRFIVQVNTQSGRIQLEAQKNFHVFQDPLDLRFRSYQAILEELQLITSREEMSRLKAVAEGERQQVLNDFWKEMDPTPGTIRNERMTEFYLRVAYVRRVYQQARHDQTLTDRAKVYIIYGEPQKVSAYQKGAFSPNIEIWDYPHAGVHVVFQDDSGMGHYRLVEPYSLFSE